MDRDHWASQHEIEKYIEKYLPPFKRAAPGFFLEIGCWDGALISQTVWLEKQKRWGGVCVDPFPRGFEDRTCDVARVAISADGLPREFVKVTNDRRPGHGDVSYFSGFKDRIGVHWDLIREYCNYEIVQVETMTMDSLYAKYKIPPRVDFLSIDVEGAELEILESIDWDHWSYGLIVFEHNENEYVIARAGTLLSAAGYVRVASLRCDDIWVNKDLL